MAVYQRFETPFSDSDLKLHLNDPKILPYGEIDKISSIEQLLPNELDYAIILPQIKRQKATGSLWLGKVNILCIMTHWATAPTSTLSGLPSS